MKKKKALNFEDPISVSEFAKMIGVSSRRVRQYIDEGRLVANRNHPRGKFFISADAVDSWAARKWIDQNAKAQHPRLFSKRGVSSGEHLRIRATKKPIPTD